MHKTLTKNRLENGRRWLYPAAALTIGVVCYFGFVYEAVPDADSLLANAEVLAYSGFYEQAGEAAQEVLELDPDNIDARLIVGLAAERSGDLSRALSIYEKLKDEMPTETKRRRLELSCIDIERRQQNFDRVNERIAACRQAGDDNPQFERILGVIAFDQGRASEAMVHFENYAQKSPESGDAKRLMIQANLLGGKISKARDLLSSVDEKSRTCWPLWPQLARTCLEAGDEEGALAALSRYAELDAYAQKRLRKDAFWRTRVDSGEFSAIFN